MAMKIQFENQDYQDAAVAAVVDLFKGQKSEQGTFSVSMRIGGAGIEDKGASNKLNISKEQLLKNLQEVQKRNKLAISESLEALHFCVEMETGTGKTFAFIKTIFELNKQYGYTKFVIVVPSIAIREGINKSFEMTHDFFQREYDNTEYSHFVFDSSKKQARGFAVNTNIEIMIINVDAFKKDTNLFNRGAEDNDDESPRAYISGTNPIVIIDEPQSTVNTDKAKAAIESLNPLCVIRYSATHREKINTVYRLTPVDAYQMSLVKQITKGSNQMQADYNMPYIKCIEVDGSKGFRAKLELDIMDEKGRVERKAKWVKAGADLHMISGERDCYEGLSFDMDITKGFERIILTNGYELGVGKAIGHIDESVFKRAQIRRTIEKHLEKEQMFLRSGLDIKVLSLFFIDEVKRYRDYEADDKKGEYARWFDEIYAELIALPRFDDLRKKFLHDRVHDGYFSQDKGRDKNTNGESLADYDTYKTIMKDKEWLLSFACPLRFIWSHSALREGWDNPNVFQVCTLIEHKTEFTARQKIGRGLRLCVDQAGKRVRDNNINILHVFSSESFEEFAFKLQREIETETGMKFGMLDFGFLDEVLMVDEATGEERHYTAAEKQEFVTTLQSRNYVEKSGKYKPTLKNDLLMGKLDLPKKFDSTKARLKVEVGQSEGITIKNEEQEVVVRANPKAFLSDEFKAIWARIKDKTYYRVKVDADKLVDAVLKALKATPRIGKPKVETIYTDLDVAKKGVSGTQTGYRTMDVETKNQLPDILRILGDNCKISRRTINRILQESGRLEDFANNPQRFIEELAEIINKQKAYLAIDGIEYFKLENEEFNIQQLFDQKERIGYIGVNAVPSNNSIYDHVTYDASSQSIEGEFAKWLSADEDVPMFFKLPPKFLIPTPVTAEGYNPDWAIYYKKNGIEKLIFIIETKGSLDPQERRGKENSKIHCGLEHFKALGVDFDVAKNWLDFRGTK